MTDDGLRTGGTVLMHHSRNGVLLAGSGVERSNHEWLRPVFDEVMWRALDGQGRTERPEAFPVFNFRVDDVLVVKPLGAHENRSVSQRPRPTLHSALEP